MTKVFVFTQELLRGISQFENPVLHQQAKMHPFFKCSLFLKSSALELLAMDMHGSLFNSVCQELSHLFPCLPKAEDCEQNVAGNGCGTSAYFFFAPF